MADRDAFLMLLLRNEAELRAFTGSLVRDRETREDIFQEVALALWQQADRYDPQRPFGAWARGIAGGGFQDGHVRALESGHLERLAGRADLAGGPRALSPRS